MESKALPHLFLIDNFDSFSYNLVDEFRCQGYGMTIFRNNVPVDTIIKRMAAQAGQVLLILSPGPGAPAAAGGMLELLRRVQGVYPVLGICLGHQAIVEHYGGTVTRAPEVVHGKASFISHDGHTIFNGMGQPLSVARYHSLMASQLPASLNLLAWVNDIPMAVLHERDVMLGLQFHPESILTTQGSQLLKQCIEFLSAILMSPEKLQPTSKETIITARDVNDVAVKEALI